MMMVTTVEMMVAMTTDRHLSKAVLIEEPAKAVAFT